MLIVVDLIRNLMLPKKRRMSKLINYTDNEMSQSRIGHSITANAAK